MNRIEDIVYYDFQGWPEYKMNLREVLMALGGKVEGDTISFDLKDPLMDVYPRILADDGMGYGVDENVIVSVDPDRQEGVINIFREKRPTDEQQAEPAPKHTVNYWQRYSAIPFHKSFSHTIILLSF